MAPCCLFLEIHKAVAREVQEGLPWQQMRSWPPGRGGSPPEEILGKDQRCDRAGVMPDLLLQALELGLCPVVMYGCENWTIMKAEG